MAAAPATRTGLSLDKRLIAWLGGAVLLLILVVSVIAPATANDDPRPSSENAGPAGAKAAYLTLEDMRLPVARWNKPLDDLRTVDAPHTTLLLLAPLYTSLDRDRLAAALRSFLERGGRVVTTGREGALLIPGGSARPSRRFGDLCYTEPEGPGPLARAGHVELRTDEHWDNEDARVFVEQRCGPDAVVVRIPVGRGEAIWWTSASPATNAELHNDTDLKLLLASIGKGRTVLFDDLLQQPPRSEWSATHGLPLRSLFGQSALVFLLLVFSFSRRRGPIRLPSGVPRSSPLEFAFSMGDLYEKAGATGAATEAARRRLLRVLVHDAGLPQRTVQAGSEAIVTALQTRFGGVWRSVGEHLNEAATASDTDPRPGTALRLVRALGEDAERVRRAARPAAAGEANGKEAETTTMSAVQAPAP